MESVAADETTAAVVTADQLYLSPSRGRCCACVPWTSARATKAWSAGSRVVTRVKEWSEVVAGPLLKVLGRMGRVHRVAGGGIGQFRYDPISYALNFDDGIGKAGDTGSPAATAVAVDKWAVDQKTVRIDR